MNGIISSNQWAFIKGRNIMDNIIIAHKILKNMKTNKNQEYNITLKLDMSKTYDIVEWKFLEKLLDKMDFNQKWIWWIMNCVKTVSYKILVYWSPGEWIQPTRGLRQGDPISPYLFLIRMEGVSSSLKKMEKEGDIASIKIKRNNPIITHLLFADDCYIFTKTKIKCVKNIKKFLKMFSKASSQTINYQKLELIFSKYTLNLIRNIMRKELGIKWVSNPGK